jgi:guanylate kinase
MSFGKGKLIVISAPSGSGKTTIAREIMKLNPSLVFSVSATTRTKRNTEVDGKDYFFLSKEEFTRKVRAGAFVEWEELYGQYYGTLKNEVENALHNGRHLLFDVDVKGALSIKRQYPDALMIFIRPPNIEVLVQRLKNRKSENDATLAKRLERVPMELEMGNQFEHHVVNNELAEAVAEVHTIVKQHLQRE